MHVCIFSEQLYAGGVDAVIANVINNWPALDDKFTLVCNNRHEGIFTILKSRIKRKYELMFSPAVSLLTVYREYLPRNAIAAFIFRGFWFFSRYLLFIYNVLKLRVFFLFLRPDALIVNNGNYPGDDSARAAVLAAKMSRIKTAVLVVHSIAVRPHPLLVPFEFIIDRLIDRHAEIICVSEAARKSLKIKRFISQPVSIIHNGAELIGASDSEKEEFKRAFRMDSSYKYISMAGTYDEAKGHDVLFSALSILKKNGDVRDFKCFIFGKGNISETERIKRLIKETGLEDLVCICGFVPDISKFYGLFSIHVSVSREYEGSSMVVLEAMASGVPVVAADTGALSEIVEDGSTGFVVPAGDHVLLAEKMRLLLIDEQLALNLGGKARQRFLSCFTAVEMANKYYDFVHPGCA